MPSAKQIYKQFCSLLLPFRGNYFWLFTIMHVVAVAVGTCYSFKKNTHTKKNHTTSGWVSGRPHHCLSRFSGKSQGSYKRATTAGGKLSVRNTMVCSTQPPSSQPIGMKAVAHGLGLLTHVRTQRQNLQQTDYNVRRWGSDGLPKLVHKCIPDRIFNELK